MARVGRALVPGDSVSSFADLPDAALRIVEESRRAVLVTLSGDSTPRAVPVCFAVRDTELVTAIDDKPKMTSRLGRLSNIEHNPIVTLLFDRWAEDWTRLGWVMVHGDARVEPVGSADAELAARYPQYAERAPSGEVIAVSPRRILWWTYE